MNKNEKLLKLAIEQLKKLICIDIKIDIKEFEDNEEDKIINLNIQGIKKTYCLEIKNNLTDATIGYMKARTDKKQHPVIVITEYMAAGKAEKFKNNDIQFIDTAGNAYLNNFPVYIYTRGNKPEKGPRHIIKKRVFTKKELRIIFVLLNNLKLIQKTYREIADTAGVGLGTTGRLIKNLKDRNYILETEGKRKLVKTDTLFEKWVTGYPEILKPGLFMGRFTGVGRWKEFKKIDPAYAQWGGEVAAAKKTGYLKPQLMTIYTDPNYLKNIIIDNRLRKDTRGNIEIFKRFWKKGPKEEVTVPPLLIYADLVDEENQRDVETAKIIYEKYMQHFR